MIAKSCCSSSVMTSSTSAVAPWRSINLAYTALRMTWKLVTKQASQDGSVGSSTESFGGLAGADWGL